MPSKIVEPPNARQREFFLARSRFVAYGGARGGGKSWAVRKKATLMGVRYPGIRMLLLRRTFPELKENHILPLQGELKGLATYKEVDKAFSFANGSRLKFGYCDSERDVLQYQGQEYDVIFLDEATQFTEYQFNTLTACIRGANPFPKRMYLTCNPGGVGHEWVKRLFIDRDYRGSEKGEDYTFIPARVYDNRALMGQDPGYVAMLENLPEDLRRAWLDMKEWLKPRGEETRWAALTVFRSCKNLIRCIPLLQFDERRPNDVATQPHEITHAPDAIRYFVAGRPVPAQAPIAQDEDDLPLDDQISDFLQYGG